MTEVHISLSASRWYRATGSLARHRAQSRTECLHWLQNRTVERLAMTTGALPRSPRTWDSTPRTKLRNLRPAVYDARVAVDAASDSFLSRENLTGDDWALRHTGPEGCMAR